MAKETFRLIKKLKNGDKVGFDYGTFDEYCVYVVFDETKRKKAYHDETYFRELQLVDSLIGSYNKVYEDFLKIYNLTTKKIDNNVINLIDDIVLTYPIQYQYIVEKWFSVIYGGMIAEELKENAILKKRIKNLGMYQTLVERKTPRYSAKFSFGKNWKDLNEIMIKKGI